MSHAPERKEKDCLNCGTTVVGHYCHVCGQENVVPKESFWSLVVHFFNDITHFDTKVFESLRYLIAKPGFLPKEYSNGRRARYLNPIRMYLLTSAIFFIIFFTITSGEQGIHVANNEPFTIQQRDSIVAELKRDHNADTNDVRVRKQLKLLADTSMELRPLDPFQYRDDIVTVGTLGGRYKNLREYDSIQKSRSSRESDGWLKRKWNKRAITLNEKFRNDPSASFGKISDLILHKLPYLLFVSLPFFALILKLLYMRRKEFYYSDHGIFSIHHYIFSFLLLLFVFLLNEMNDITGWGIWNFLMVVSLFGWPVYLFVAMKRFYRQSFFKTLGKFLLLNIAGLVVLILLTAVFFLFSVFQL